MHIALVIKKLITLLALVDPFSMVPVYLGAIHGKTAEQKQAFARGVGFAVSIALLVSAFAGSAILSAFGISFGSMQVAGGILALILAIAMVLGKAYLGQGRQGDECDFPRPYREGRGVSAGRDGGGEGGNRFEDHVSGAGQLRVVAAADRWPPLRTSLPLPHGRAIACR
jgi:hypothetical protein